MSQIGNKTECGMLGFVIALGMILRKNFFGSGGGVKRGRNKFPGGWRGASKEEGEREKCGIFDELINFSFKIAELGKIFSLILAKFELLV